MKLALFIIVALAASAFGFTTVDHNNGHDILREVEAGNHNVYVIMFYAEAAEGSGLANRNKDYEDALNSQVLDNFGSFFYTKVDARNQDYQDLVDEVGITVSELQKSPSVLIMENGNGAWIHGPETIAKIAEYAPAYNKRSSDS